MTDRSERFVGFVAAARVGGPATAIAFMAGVYLLDQGKVSPLGVLGVALLGGVAGFALGAIVWRGSAAAADRLVRTITASGGTSPSPSFSYAESLVASGNPQQARRVYEARLREAPGDLNARLALARLWRDHLGDAGKAEQLYLQARGLGPTVDQEFAIGNALIDLYRGQGDRGREMTELARFAERFAGTQAGAGARSALQRLKSSER